MAEITMNDWIIEQGEREVEAVIEIWDLVGDDRVVRELETIYTSAMKMIAYATGGFTQNFHVDVRKAFNDGPVAMRGLVHDLKDRDYEGWDLPNPNYHRTVLNL